jgi:predicted aspartyl protease
MSTFVMQKPPTSQSVPFRLAGGQNPLILVPVYVDNKGPYEFILDTGASHCLLSQELSVILGVRPESEKQATGAGGSVKLVLGHVSSIAVGSVHQTNVPVAITPELEQIAVAIRSRVDGDLGFGFLKDFSITIDYDGGTLSFATGLPRGHQSPLANSIPFELAAPHKPLILVQVTVNHQGPFQFALDTGASRTMLSTELARRLAIETSDDSPVSGGGGQIKILAGKLSSLAVGGAVVRDHAIGAGGFLNILSTAIGTKLDGIIGYNFLNQFKVTIDYPRSTLELVPAVFN